MGRSTSKYRAFRWHFMTKISHILKNLLVLLAGIILALIVLEIALRLFPPFEMRFKPDRIVLPVNKRYIFDNTEKFPTKLAKTTHHTKNSLGFRGAPLPANLADYLSIITIGGSTTECFYLSDGRPGPISWGLSWPGIFPRSGSTTPVWMAPPLTAT